MKTDDLDKEFIDEFLQSYVERATKEGVCPGYISSTVQRVRHQLKCGYQARLTLRCLEAICKSSGPGVSIQQLLEIVKDYIDNRSLMDYENEEELKKHCSF